MAIEAIGTGHDEIFKIFAEIIKSDQATVARGRDEAQSVVESHEEEEEEEI